MMNFYRQSCSEETYLKESHLRSHQCDHAIQSSQSLHSRTALGDGKKEQSTNSEEVQQVFIHAKDKLKHLKVKH